jgi:hypothetical protein
LQDSMTEPSPCEESHSARQRSPTLKPLDTRSADPLG